MAVGRISTVQSAGRMGPAPVAGKINASHVIGALGGLALLAGAAYAGYHGYQGSQGFKENQAFKMDQEVASGKRPNPFVEASEARKRVGEIQMESMGYDGYPKFENQVNQGLINAGAREKFQDVRDNYRGRMGRQ